MQPRLRRRTLLWPRRQGMDQRADLLRRTSKRRASFLKVIVNSSGALQKFASAEAASGILMENKEEKAHGEQHGLCRGEGVGGGCRGYFLAIQIQNQTYCQMVAAVNSETRRGCSRSAPVGREDNGTQYSRRERRIATSPLSKSVTC